MPTGLAAGLRALPSHSVVYNDDAVGGWLMWSFPELEQTADTRAELYGPARARAYLNDMSADEGWQACSTGTGPPQPSYARPLPWRVIYGATFTGTSSLEIKASSFCGPVSEGDTTALSRASRRGRAGSTAS